MFKKYLKRTIILGVVALVLAVILIVANVILNQYSVIINAFLAGDTSDTTGEGAQNALSEADKTVRETAEESMVLLENDNYLPKTDLKKVNLFGWGSTDAGFLLTGGGSGGTSILDTDKDGNPRVKVDLTDAFKEAGIEYNTELTAAYEKFSTFDADYRSNGSTGANATQSLKNPTAEFYTNELMSAAKSYSNVAIAVISRWGAENGGGSELKSIGSYTDGTFLELTVEEKAMFDKLNEYGFEVVVLLNVCNNIEAGFLQDYSNIKACLFVGIPGQSGASAIPKILNGTVNPSGRTSDTWAYDYQTYNPVYVNAVKNGNDLTYQEGIYFGYKWYETADADGYFEKVPEKYGKTGYGAVVQFPFGYGLSYTTFSWDIDWSGVGALRKENSYEVKVTVTNNGSVAGKDVVQLYGHAPYDKENGGIEKAERILLDFAKTKLLAPGESDTVKLTFRTYDMASYDAYDANKNNFIGYELEKGDYKFSIMQNAHDEVDSKDITLAQEIRYPEDPDTNKAVGNLFTGSNAYANIPTDGSTAFATKIEYLSRKDCFKNFPTTPVGTQNKFKDRDNSVPFRYDGYDNEDISNIEYDSDMGLYLTGVEIEGSSSLLRPTTAQLGMEKEVDTSVPLVMNTEILTIFTDYDSEYWDLLLNQLTADEIKDLIGKGNFQTIGLYSLGKPRAEDKDGPSGFNNNVSSPGKAGSHTLLPSESLIGCSWNKEIAREIGRAQGRLGSSEGVNFSGWYAPGVNLHRSVYNSRNYEYFSEDGVISGKLAAEIIDGAKEYSVYCYLKHFAVSEAGQNPKNLSTWLTEQTLRETYLKPFEIAIKSSGANAVMSAFNRVGAVLSVYNHALLTDVLRTEWGFRGSVITDWYMTTDNYAHDYERGVLAGNDLWLSGTEGYAAKLDLSKPGVAYAARQSAKNILYTYIDTKVTAGAAGVNAAPHSALFAALVIVMNVLLAVGIAVCVVFIALPFVIPFIKKLKGGKAVEAVESSENGEPEAVSVEEKTEEKDNQ